MLHSLINTTFTKNQFWECQQRCLMTSILSLFYQVDRKSLEILPSLELKNKKFIVLDLTFYSVDSDDI